MDEVDVRCNVIVWTIDAETGDVIDEYRGHNLLVSAGRNAIATWLLDGTGTQPTHIAFGDDDTAVSASQTTLVSEIASGRFAFTSTSRMDNVTRYEYNLTSAQLNGETLKELGLFNASSSGTMFSRIVLGTSISKTSSIAVTVKWDYSVGV